MKLIGIKCIKPHKGNLEGALLNKSSLDKTTPYQSLSQAIRTLFGIPTRVILFKARIRGCLENGQYPTFLSRRDGQL